MKITFEHEGKTTVYETELALIITGKKDENGVIWTNRLCVGKYEDLCRLYMNMAGGINETYFKEYYEKHKDEHKDSGDILIKQAEVEKGK